jgi:tRNA pseudouridine55 synthase
MQGMINLDKPSGITSARVVDAVKRLLPRGTKVGHAGTLDRFATGVLLILIGNATRHCETLMGQPKTYEGTVKLGVTTATDDPESAEETFLGNEAQVLRPGLDEVRRALGPFVGEILQRPPVYSALKLAGKRASDRARAGQRVLPEPRRVHVYSIDLLDYQYPFARLRIECGRGTYIRSIARDLGEALGTGAYLTQLRRTRIGSHDTSGSVKLEDLTVANIPSHVLPAVAASL